MTMVETKLGKMYSSSTKIMEKDIVYTPGLGYTPILVVEKRVLSSNTVKKIKELLSVNDVLETIYIIEPDPDYINLLRKTGFEVGVEDNNPYIAPIMQRIYGEIKGRFIVSKPGSFTTFYPPLGNHDDGRKAIFILKSVADKLGIIVHENVHYVIDAMNLQTLRAIEEPLARFYEIIAEMNCPTIPIVELEEKLKDENVVRELDKLLKILEIRPEPHIKRHQFINVVDAVEEGILDPCTVARIIRGETCIEVYGYVSRFVPCSRKN